MPDPGDPNPNVLPFRPPPSPTRPGSKPRVEIVEGRIDEITAEVQRYLLNTGLYQRAGKIVKPILIKGKDRYGNETQSPGILTIDRDELRRHATEYIDFLGFNRKHEPVAADYTLEYAAALLKLPPQMLDFPVLRGVISTPLVLMNGHVVQTPGYDERTGLFFMPLETEFEPIPAVVTDAMMEADLKLLKGLLAEYPFRQLDEDKEAKRPKETQEHNAAQSGALALLLTASNRGAFGQVPMFAANGNIARVGKGKLMSSAAILATNEPAAVVRFTNPDEFDKTLSMCLVTGVTHIAIDNVSVPLDSDYLCSCITEPVIRIRGFGSIKERLDIPNVCMVTVTGNKLVLVGDLGPRTIVIEIVSPEEDPETAVHTFDPVVKAKDNRGAYVSAALRLIKGYIDRGRPGKPKPLGSFEEWSDTIRGLLIYMGEPDPVLSIGETKATNSKAHRLRVLMAEWRNAVKEGTVSVAQLIDIALNYQPAHQEFPLQDALQDIIGKGILKESARKIGKYLVANKDINAGGYKLVCTRDTTKEIYTWTLVKVGSNSSPIGKIL
jgi:putative DNA primase/helicase